MSLDFSDQSSTEPAVTADEEAPEATETADEVTTPPPAPASFVLFQAPDPTTVAPPRARRDPQETDDAADEEDRSSGRGGDRSGGRSSGGGRGAAARGTKAGQTDDSEHTDAEGDTDADAKSADDDGDDEQSAGRGRRRRGGRGRRANDSARDGDQRDDAAGDANDANSGDNAPASGDSSSNDSASDDDSGEGNGDGSSRRRTRRRRRSGSGNGAGQDSDQPGTVTKVREARRGRDEVTAIKGSTRLEAKKQRRREGREAGRKRTVITEAEFLARRESVERQMVVRDKDGRTQIGVMEDGVLVEHYVSQDNQSSSMAGNVYLGRVQNVLPSMEAAFVDIGRGRNAVLYAGEVNWDAAGLDGQPKRIEHALKSGETVLVQVTKDPIGHKGARLTSQISLPGRYLVYVPGNSMTGISRKLPDTERARLKKILKDVVPADAGVIVRTAAEGASEEELRADVERLTAAWEQIEKKAASSSTSAPSLLRGESELTVRVIRDVFNEDFSKLVVSGDEAWNQISSYIESVAPDLRDRLEKWTGEKDVFTVHRIDEQIAKAMDRKVWLPSGGSLIIDRTEAMTVIDVNTGKYVGSGGNLEETVTKNNLEAAEEIVRQLRLRDLGGIIVVDFIDMVLESNRDLVVRRLLECLGRDRTKHQVAEVTSLGLVQMTRKRVGSGLLEVFSESCDHCQGRGVIVHDKPVTSSGDDGGQGGGNGRRKGRGRSNTNAKDTTETESPEQKVDSNGRTAAQIAAAAHAAAQPKSAESEGADGAQADETGVDAGVASEVPASDAPAQETPAQAVANQDAPQEQPAPAHSGGQASGDTDKPKRGRSRRARASAGQASIDRSAEQAPSAPRDEHSDKAEQDQPAATAQQPVEQPAVTQAPVETPVQQAPTTGPVSAPAEQEQPAPRARRRRGRVVAAAGPPPAATEETGTGGNDDNVTAD